MAAAPIPELSQLDQSKIDDIDLTSEELRQAIQNGLIQSWAIREPFYVVSRGIIEVVICRHKDVFEVLNDRERFTATLPPIPGVEHLDHFNGAEHLGRMDGTRHDDIRRVMNPPFAPPGLAPHEAAIRAIFDEKIDRILAMGGDFDAMADLCSDLIKRVLLGVILQLTPEQQAVMDTLHKRMGLVMQTEPGQPHPAEFTEAYEAARVVIFDIIEQRRKQPADDFIGRLVAAKDSGGVVDSDETIFGNTLAIVAAGLVASTLHTAHEAGWLTAGQGQALDLTWLDADGEVIRVDRHVRPGRLRWCRGASAVLEQKSGPAVG